MYCCHNIIQMFKKIQMVHFDQICPAQNYEIKFKIQQKRQDTRHVKKKRKVDLFARKQKK